MIDAVKRGDIAAVGDLLQSEPTLVDATAETGESAFLLASYYGQKAIADLLLSRGARLNLFEAAVAGDTARVSSYLAQSPELARAYSHDGWTGLHLAAYFGRQAAAEALIAAGADVNARTTNSQNNLPLHAAAAGKHREIVDLLLDNGADVDARQEGGWVALHEAAQDGDVEMIGALLAHGADVNARNDAGQTPLTIALSHDQTAAADALRKHGAVE
jgi:ankyrin repeat protein